MQCENGYVKPDVKIEDVIPNRYSFAIANMSAEEIERRINAKLP